MRAPSVSDKILRQNNNVSVHYASMTNVTLLRAFWVPLISSFTNGCSYTQNDDWRFQTTRVIQNEKCIIYKRLYFYYLTPNNIARNLVISFKETHYLPVVVRNLQISMFVRERLDLKS